MILKKMNEQSKIYYSQMNKKGFSLLELIVVIVIIAILVGLSSTKFMAHAKEAQVTSMYKDIDTLQKAILVEDIEGNNLPLKSDKYVSTNTDFLQYINSNLNDDGSNLYEIDLSKIKTTRLKYGNGKTIEDIYVYSKDTGYVYYVKGMLDSKDIRHYCIYKFNSLNEVDMDGVQKVSFGNSHTLILMKDGTVKSFGQNWDGQLGFGDNIHRTTPETIPNLKNVKDISAGGFHSLVLLNDGTVMAFGNNWSGELGLGDTDSRNTPTLIPNLNNVKSISTTSSHTLALLDNGTVMAFGGNRDGQLGLGDNIDRLTPTLIPDLNDVKEVVSSTGGYYSLILLNNGKVMSFGDNSHEQLGLGDTNNRNIPTLIPNLNNVKQISAGYYQSLALLNNGTVMSFGDNYEGNLGLGENDNKFIPTLIPNLNNVEKISVGYNHSFVLLNNGTVKSFGNNGYGKTGILGAGNVYSATLIPNITNVKDIVVGENNSLLILNNGNLMIWGDNYSGQLGLGTNGSDDGIYYIETPTLIPNL